MVLEEVTRIEASPERIFAFFMDIEAQYVAWHPDHITFRWIEGEALHEGSVAYYEERIAGKVKRMKVRYTRVVPNRYIEFVPASRPFRLLLPRMSFAVEEQQDGASLLRAQVHVRIGPLGRRLNRRELEAVERHMKEGGENLKRWAESQ
jgi:uncharacterized protein YndB with AHSA1/START domain